MYTLFSSEKLGMPVEELRLREIRQQIEVRRLGDEMNENQPVHRLESSGEWLNRLKVFVANMRWNRKHNAV